ncbi:MAG: hypothetical protein EOM05_05940 [Clostridia bacterium]|nr:hypothetical protein [Clostridia bacterium]
MNNNIVFKKIISAFCAIFLLVYISYQGYMMVYKPVKTEIAYEYTIYDTVQTQIFVVRDEKYITNNATGTFVPVVEDGKRVSNSQEVAIVFANTQAASNYIRIKELEESIERYKTLASQAEGYTIDLDTVDDEITSRLFSYIDTISTGKLDTLKDSSDALRDKIITRQIVTGQTIDFASRISSLESELSSIKKKDSTYQSITATQAGYYINEVDGFENTISYDNATSLTVDDIDKALETSASQIPSNAVGKLVNNFDWYMVCNVDSNSVGNIGVGDNIKVLLPFSSVSEVTAEVVTINDTNSKKTALILRCNLMNSDLSTLRKESAELVFNKYKGFKVPSSAIRINEEGEKGVYVQTGNIISFKKVEVLYSSKEFLLVGNKDELKGYINLYDNIVVEGTDLYDGKIIG